MISGIAMVLHYKSLTCLMIVVHGHPKTGTTTSIKIGMSMIVLHKNHFSDNWDKRVAMRLVPSLSCVVEQLAARCPFVSMIRHLKQTPTTSLFIFTIRARVANAKEGLRHQYQCPYFQQTMISVVKRGKPIVNTE